jgi:uncharacterized protein with PIN domain
VRLFADAMLGSLATHLRFLGHDTAYALEEGIEDDDAVLARVAATRRTLVTRDRELAARAPGSILVTSRAVEDQLAELADAGLALSVPPEPTRCGSCNGALEALPPGEPTPEYAPDPGDAPGDGRVWRCVSCGQHFWKGSHWSDMRETVRSV